MNIDLHVHMVGNGSGGTGCWYRPRGWTRLGEPWMLRGFGLDSRDMEGDLDAIYAGRLLSFVQSSSLDAVVILAQDEPHDSSGRVLENMGSFYVPNDHVLGLAAAHPEFLAGISIHPARADAMEELERCLGMGAALLKCLPNCQNIDWSDPRYTRFLERMAESGLPLLAHTGGEHTLPVVDRRLADPRVLVRPLEVGVTCIAAHCGTASGLFDPDYFDAFSAMVEKYPNLYGDNSAFNVPNGRLRAKHLDRCLRAPLLGRVLHGSDAPVPVLGHEAYVRGYIGRRAFLSSLKEANPLERDYQLKRAMGFPEESFALAVQLLRMPAASRSSRGTE
jgi:predicted TIM-barrel fold metal-dependent hydrolase